MATAENDSEVLTNTAPSGAVGEDCTWLSEWTASSGGTFLDRFELTNNPAALQLGDRYRIAPGSIVKTEPGFKRGTSVPSSPILGQVFQYSSNQSSLSNHYNTNGTTATTSASSGDIFVYNGSRWIKQSAEAAVSYQTEAQAVRALTARVAGGLWYQCHGNDPGVNGTANVITGINRFDVPESEWDISSS